MCRLIPRGLIVSTGSTGYKGTRSDTNAAVRLQGQYFNPFIILFIMSANDLTAAKGVSVIKECQLLNLSSVSLILFCSSHGLRVQCHINRLWPAFPNSCLCG